LSLYFQNATIDRELVKCSTTAKARIRLSDRHIFEPSGPSQRKTDCPDAKNESTYEKFITPLDLEDVKLSAWVCPPTKLILG
jgi:hypothetical protein